MDKFTDEMAVVEDLEVTVTVAMAEIEGER